ncbi:MAG: hypothetical protein AAF662_06855 [Pseudomonadota bacterium]
MLGYEDFYSTSLELVENKIEGKDVEVPDGISVIDVFSDLSFFSRELNYLNELGVGFPALRVNGELVPCSFLHADDKFFQLLNVEKEFYLFSRSFERILRIGGEFMLSEDAQLVVRKGAASSIARRLAYNYESLKEEEMKNGRVNLEIPAISGGNPVKTTGATFVVTTNTHGLSVLKSGAYYIRPSGTTFGGPSSPVARTLLDGDYIFGVIGNMYTTVDWDLNQTVVVPDTTSVHLHK